MADVADIRENLLPAAVAEIDIPNQVADLESERLEAQYNNVVRAKEIEAIKMIRATTLYIHRMFDTLKFKNTTATISEKEVRLRIMRKLCDVNEEFLECLKAIETQYADVLYTNSIQELAMAHDLETSTDLPRVSDLINSVRITTFDQLKARLRELPEWAVINDVRNKRKIDATIFYVLMLLMIAFIQLIFIGILLGIIYEGIEL